MMIWLIVLLVVHAVPAVFWAGSTFALARQPLIGTDLSLAQAQAGAAGVTILAGIALWAMNHAYEPGTGEWVLGLGALCALAAAGIQHAVAWPARRRISQAADPEAPEAASDRARAALGQRAASLLLAVTVITMVIWRYV